MLKNTYYAILFLSIFAALIVGLNIGKRIQQNQNTTGQIQTLGPSAPSLSSAPLVDRTINSSNIDGSPSANHTIATSSGTTGKEYTYTNTACGIAFTYPDTIIKEDSSTQTQGAIFTSKTNSQEMVVVTCQKDIPKPALPQENIEQKLIGSVQAKLYHDSSAKDGTKTDALIFTHPKTKLDVFIGGYGTTFNTIIQSLEIL